jgi:hypothetical protein
MAEPLQVSVSLVSLRENLVYPSRIRKQRAVCGSVHQQ